MKIDFLISYKILHFRTIKKSSCVYILILNLFVNSREYINILIVKLVHYFLEF